MKSLVSKKSLLFVISISFLIASCGTGVDATSSGATQDLPTTPPENSVPSDPPSEEPPASPPIASCPNNYVKIQASSEFSTSEFCIAQFEMKVQQNDGTPVFDGYNGGVALDVNLYVPQSRPDGVPWVKILQANAVSECASLGAGYHLASIKEWQIVAREIESVNANWSGNLVGVGGLYTGHSDGAIAGTAVADGNAATGSLLLSAKDGLDPYIGTGQSDSLSFGSGKEQKRTFILASGEAIWDMSGNARELVDIDGLGGTLSYTGPTSANFYELNSSQFSNMITTAASSNGQVFDSSFFLPATAMLDHLNNKIGKVYLNANSQSLRVVGRGGNFSSGNSPGLFAADFDQVNTGLSSSAGFRCVGPLQ